MLTRAFFINAITIAFTSFLFVYFINEKGLIENFLLLLIVFMISLCVMYQTSAKWLKAKTFSTFKGMFTLSPVVLIPYFLSVSVYKFLPSDKQQLMQNAEPNMLTWFVSNAILCLVFTAFLVIFVRLSVLYSNLEQDSQKRFSTAFNVLFSNKTFAILPFVALAALSLSFSNLISGAVTVAALMLLVVVVDIVVHGGVACEE